ncbi:hypothetical protein [Streptomyces umbrinus]|uniref:hypothetical protein n=1 Tax=Streptomyces umbrinus TaxID=67370 RepID=UPI0027D84FA1|nr:hypothetical protein [Streptomyces umbrinus]
MTSARGARANGPSDELLLRSGLIYALLPDLPERIRSQTAVNREFSARHVAALPGPSSATSRPKTSRARKSPRTSGAATARRK